MIDVLKIKKELKQRLERFWSSYCECGGFLLANRVGVVDEFIPMPNRASDPKSQFLPPNDGLDLARRYAKAKSRHWSHSPKVVAFFHTHPHPCVMSVADVSASGSLYPDLLFVTISPVDSYGYPKNFIWYASKGIAPRGIEFV